MVKTEHRNFSPRRRQMLLLLCLSSSAVDVVAFPLGSGEIVALTDSRTPGSNKTLINASLEDQQRYIPDGTYPMGTHAFLYIPHSGGPILFDAANGFNLLDNLAAVGVSAASIETIFVTHMHGDHIGGLTGSTGAVFPNAVVYIEAKEFDYWKNLTDRSHTPTGPGFVFGNYSGRIRTFNATDSEVNQTGVIAIEARGHTPGHTGFVVDNLFLWGDLTHAMAIQMPVPRVAVTYDIDPVEAVETRLRLLAQAVESGWNVGGAHLPWPPVGTLQRASGDGYVFQAFATPAPTPAPSPTDNATGKTVGIVAGVVLGVIVVLAVAIVCIVRRRQSYKTVP
jgi:glyoxylase-like metal-dependent hydrolase (beta-lactamase superfamily II)